VLGLSTPGCDAEAVLEVRDQRVRGRSRVGVSLPAGRHDYSLRCLHADGTLAEEPAATGRIRVLRDAGRTPLPLRPPTNVVEADGRRYTVMYQNLLPRVVVRWSDAPSAGPYTLSFASEGRPRQSRRPRFELPSGALREGTHVLSVQGADGARSRSTSVVIRFDNAAPTASIRQPADGSFLAGQRVQVSGIAQRGWRVHAEGEPLPLDAHYRFSGEVTAPARRDALAIRLSHPRRGVHYYLRRVRGGGSP
jgi:hypothetical protein